jgi:rubrerythrin
MGSKCEDTYMKKKSNRRGSALCAAVVLLTGCVGSELEIPVNHPGHAAAAAGTLTLTTPLSKDLDVHEREGAAPASAHGDHEHRSEQKPSQETPKDASYVCPMHPEIVRGAPGSCPICGMKLVPKKDAK